MPLKARVGEETNVHGKLSGDIFATKNLRNDSILAFPLKLTVELVNLESLTTSKISGVSSITPVASNYMVKLGTNNCLYLYSGDSLLCQINVPELMHETKQLRSDNTSKEARVNVSTPRAGISKYPSLALNQVN